MNLLTLLLTAALGWLNAPGRPPAFADAAPAARLIGGDPRAGACGGQAPDNVDSAIAQGRWWHASLLLRRLPPGRTALAASDVVRRARVAEGLERWTIVDSLLRRVRGGDTIPAFLATAARADEHAARWSDAARRYRLLATLPNVDQQTRDAATVRLAVAFEAMNRLDSAGAAWRRAAQALPEIADWLTLHRADHEDDTTLAFAALAGMRSPGARKWADGVAARRREQAGNYAGALESLRRIDQPLDRYGSQPLDVARVQFELGRKAQARARADSVLFLDPTRPPNGLLAAQFLTQRFDTLTIAEYLAVSRAYRARGARAMAEHFARLATRVGRDTSVAAWLEVASVLSWRKDDIDAMRAVDSAGARAGPARAPMIAAARARVMLASGVNGRAADFLAQLARVYPGDTSVAQVLILLANQYRSHLELADELRVYHTLLDRFPDAPATNLARFRLGLVFYAAGPAAMDTARALITGAAGRDSTRQLGVGLQFWRARVRYEAGDTTAAADLRRIATLMPITYYGVRSRMVLRDTAFVVDTALAPQPVGSYAPERARERVRLLASLGFEAEARAEAAGWLGDTAATVPVLLAAAAAAADAGYARESIWLGEAARQRAGLVPLVARALFPIPYESVIDGEAAEQCIDPLLLAAIIRQESRFDPHAVSAAGAHGIAQVMPPTGRDLARRLHIPDWNPSLLFVPDNNIHLGTRYLLDRVQLDSMPVYAVLAAYNAGAARVRSWRQWPEFNDPDLFAERVSISQTNDYVKTVYMSYVWYRRLYGPAEGAGASPQRPLAPYP